VISSVGSDIVAVQGLRAGKPYRYQVDLPSLFGGDKRDDDIILQANDVVFVDRAPTAYIYGQVQRPGPFRIERGMTLLQGLASGGGPTLRGTEKGIRVHRRDGDKIEIIEPGMDELLRNGDVIFVRESLF